VSFNTDLYTPPHSIKTRLKSIFIEDNNCEAFYQEYGFELISISGIESLCKLFHIDPIIDMKFYIYKLVNSMNAYVELGLMPWTVWLTAKKTGRSFLNNLVNNPILFIIFICSFIFEGKPRTTELNIDLMDNLLVNLINEIKRNQFPVLNKNIEWIYNSTILTFLFTILVRNGFSTAYQKIKKLIRTRNDPSIKDFIRIIHSSELTKINKVELKSIFNLVNTLGQDQELRDFTYLISEHDFRGAKMLGKTIILSITDRRKARKITLKKQN
jgi:hypothetical protein